VTDEQDVEVDSEDANGDASDGRIELTLDAYGGDVQMPTCQGRVKFWKSNNGWGAIVSDEVPGDV
jgi:hypothetical protein